MPNIDQETRDKTSPVWDMSQERLLTEQIIAQRLNFLLLFFSLSIAGAFNSRVQLHLSLILSLGGLVVFFLALAIKRTEQRLNAILQFLREDSTHPYRIISERVGGPGVRKWLWVFVPWLCFTGIGSAALLSWFEVLKVAPCH